MKAQKIVKFLSVLFAIATIITAIYTIVAKTHVGFTVVLMVITIVLQSIDRSYRKNNPY